MSNIQIFQSQRCLFIFQAIVCDVVAWEYVLLHMCFCYYVHACSCYSAKRVFIVPLHYIIQLAQDQFL